MSVYRFNSANAQFRNIPSEVTDSFIVNFQKLPMYHGKTKSPHSRPNLTINNEKLKAYLFIKRGVAENRAETVAILKLPAKVKDGFNKSKYADYAVTDVTKQMIMKKDYCINLWLQKRETSPNGNYILPTQGQLVKDDMNF